jgi:hypothetical protein
MAAEGERQTSFLYHFLMVIIQLQVLDWYKIPYILDIVLWSQFPTFRLSSNLSHTISLHSQWRCCRRPCLEGIWHTKCNSRSSVSYSHCSRISGREFNIYSKFSAFRRNVAHCFWLWIETNTMFMYRIVSQRAVDFEKNAVLHTDVCRLW